MIYPTWTPRPKNPGIMADPLKQFIRHSLNERDLRAMARAEPDFAKRCEIEQQLMTAVRLRDHWAHRVSAKDLILVTTIIKRRNVA